MKKQTYLKVFIAVVMIIAMLAPVHTIYIYASGEMSSASGIRRQGEPETKSGTTSSESSVQTAPESSKSESAQGSASVSSESSMQTASESSKSESAQGSASVSSESSVQTASGSSKSEPPKRSAQVSLEGSTQVSSEGSTQVSSEDGTQASSEDDTQASSKDSTQTSPEDSAQISQEGSGPVSSGDIVQAPEESGLTITKERASAAEGQDASAYFHAQITADKDTFASGSSAIFSVKYKIDRGSVHEGDFVFLTVPPEIVSAVDLSVSPQHFSEVEDLGEGRYRLIFGRARRAPSRGASPCFSQWLT